MLQAFDFRILEWIHTHLSSPPMDCIMMFFTRLGDYGILWIVIGLTLLFWQKTRPAGIAMLFSLAIGALVGNVILKNLFTRPRPFVISGLPLLIAPPSGYSFPSGHTLASFAGSQAIFLYNKKWGLLGFLVAAIIGFSRLYLHVHFFTDVLAGALLGIAAGFVGYFISKRLTPKIDSLLYKKA